MKRLVPSVSFSAVRAKIYGRPFTNAAMLAIVQDIAAQRYSDIEMAALITAVSGNRMDIAETLALTEAMVSVGQRLHWDADIVVDKHCVGGLPGNRTTLLVVPIVAACGLTIPKTSSRAITSPAGTADTMETLAPVILDLPQISRVVGQHNGCIVWGGAVNLSPADDLLIRVERPLGLDSDGLLVASILSKKIAAGSTHVLIDIPIGRTAKLRSQDAAHRLSQRLQSVGKSLGIQVDICLTDGSQPVGIGIGPALEAHDILAILQNQVTAPADLRERALRLAGGVLEMGGKAAVGEGLELARQTLVSGAAWKKFQAICEAQGGMREPGVAPLSAPLLARHAGHVLAIDNRRLARIATLAGAPNVATAGLSFFAHLGSKVEVGQPLLQIHAESSNALATAMEFAQAQEDLITVQEGDLA